MSDVPIYAWILIAIVAIIVAVVVVLVAQAGKPRLFEINEELSLWCSNSIIEFTALKSEFFAEPGTNIYLQQGVSVKEGDTIFDVGANNGFFAISMLEIVPNISLHCFEPVPFTYFNIARNVESWLRNHPQSKSKAVVHEMGLSDAPGRIRFKQLPTSSCVAYSEGDLGHFEENVQKNYVKNPVNMIKNGIQGAHKNGDMTERSAKRAEAFFSVPIVGTVAASLLLCFPALITWLIAKVHTRWVDCKLSTVSDMIKETKTTRIDLLKVDVEGAEHLVLAGIENDDWDKIQQVAVEVHDIDGRLNEMNELLISKGFETVKFQEDNFHMQLFQVHYIYAVRKS